MPPLEQIATGDIAEVRPLRFNLDGSPRLDGGDSSNKDTIEVTFLSLPALLNGYIKGTIQHVEVMSFLKTEYDKGLFNPQNTRLYAFIDFINRFGQAVTALDLFPMISFSNKSLESSEKRLSRLKKYMDVAKWMDAKKHEVHNLYSHLPQEIFEGLYKENHLPHDNQGNFFLLFEKPVSRATTFDNLYRMLEAQIRAYGDRSKNALEKGFDGKHSLHAYRLTVQIKEILTKGYITYPLADAPTMIKIRTGEIETQAGLKLAADNLREIEQLTLSMPNWDSMRTASRASAYDFLAKNALNFYQRLEHLKTSLS
jgi:hypothetical protein